MDKKSSESIFKFRRKSITSLAYRLLDSLKKAREEPKVLIPVSYLSGPLKIASHLAESRHWPAKHVVVVDTDKGPFVLYGVSVLANARATRDNYVTVTQLKSLTDNDLRDHYSFIVLAAQTFFTGRVDEIMMAYVTRREGVPIDDLRIFVNDSFMTISELSLCSCDKPTPNADVISEAVGWSLVGDIFHCCSGSLQPFPAQFKRRSRPETPHSKSRKIWERRSMFSNGGMKKKFIGRRRGSTNCRSYGAVI